MRRPTSWSCSLVTRAISGGDVIGGWMPVKDGERIETRPLGCIECVTRGIPSKIFTVQYK